MKTIYLKENNIWKEFQYELISELKDELEARNIEIGNYVTIGNYVMIEYNVTILSGANIGNDVTIGYDVTIEHHVMIGSGAKIGSGVTIGYAVTIGSDAKIGKNAKIEKNNSFFAFNIYKYSCGAWIEENRGEIIKLGCFTRTRNEWEDDFWNNDDEFPNDNSDDSNARFRAFKICCFFLDLIKKNNERGKK